MTNDQKIIKNKVGMLDLAKQLGSVSEACRIFGYSRDSFYRFKQLDNVDHAESASEDDSLDLQFGITARDSDGDTVASTLTITINDDPNGPTIANITRSITEDAEDTGINAGQFDSTTTSACQ